MAEEIVALPEQQAAAPAINPEVAKMMDIHLNGGIIPEAKEGQPTAIQDQPPVVVTDIFTPFKEKFGYQTPEDAIKEIEELRTFKAAPPTPTEYEFENEDSKKLFKAFSKGDRKEIYNILAQQERLDAITSAEINDTNADDVIKLGMSLKYKDLTQKEIDYKFGKQYSFPKEPVRGITEEDADFEAKHQEWQAQVDDVKMMKVIDAKLAKPELESAKSKIVLPEISEEVDEDYIQYKKSLEDQPKVQAELSVAYKAFTPKMVETKLNFNDEASKIAFEFQYEPDGESFGKSVDMALDLNKFLDSFKNQDGTPDRQRFLKTINNALNMDRILMEAMKQAKNATIKSFLPDNSGGLVRQLPQTQELSELDKQMKAAGVIR